MGSELLDRLLGRIVQETRLARAARHPRARIAHHMLADAYRALVSRMLLEDAPSAIAPAGLAASRRRHDRPTGFLTDTHA